MFDVMEQAERARIGLKNVFLGLQLKEKNRMVKYQVFISSVSHGLKNARLRVINRLMSRENLFPIAMEYFTSYFDTVQMLYQHLTKSDFYILILTDYIGSAIGTEGAASFRTLCQKNSNLETVMESFLQQVHKKLEEITFTQLEYIIAEANNMIVIPFVYTESDDRFDFCINQFNGEPLSKMAMKCLNEEELASQVDASLQNVIMTSDVDPMAGWVRKKDSSLYQNIMQAGVKKFILDGRGDLNEFKNSLKGADVLWLLFTTGRGFIINNQDTLAKFVAEGGTIRLISGTPGSSFLQEVADVESVRFGNRNDIHKEFRLVMETLIHIAVHAKEKYNNSASKKFGRIEFGDCGMLFRSSMVICDFIDKSQWGWITLTLPPEKSVDMITLELEHFENDDDNKDNMMRVAKDHVASLWNLAEHKNRTCEITENTNLEALIESFTVRPYLQNKEYWDNKQKRAKILQRKIRRNKKILIEVAAQHPLEDYCRPGVEFTARLEKTLEMYSKFKKDGIPVEIFVPGSVHLANDGTEEDCSLSEAGVNWLLEAGIPESDLHGEDLIEHYQNDRNWPGVYNTGDECDIAARYFLEEDNGFGKLFTVCSPNQLLRKTLFYLDHEINAYVITVPVDNMFHDFLYEIYNVLPTVLMYDTDFQGLDSREAVRTRYERMHSFKV